MFPHDSQDLLDPAISAQVCELIKLSSFIMVPVAVVTGANSGLGLALAVKLAGSHRVLAGMRSLAKKDSLMEAASKAAVVENLKPVELDVNTATSWCFSLPHFFSKN